MAIDTLKDLFLNDLLPSRKLLFFHEQPVPKGSATIDERLLVFWYFEDALKHRYALFIEHLESAMQDTLSHVKKKACRVAFDMLRSKSEQEGALLFLLVNKLGDPDKQIASLVSHLSARLLQVTHPCLRGDRLVSHLLERIVCLRHRRSTLL